MLHPFFMGIEKKIQIGRMEPEAVYRYCDGDIRSKQKGIIFKKNLLRFFYHHCKVRRLNKVSDAVS